MRASYPSVFYTCVVSFENTGEKSDFIPENCWGASGLVAVDTTDEDELEKILRVGFSHINLRLLDIGSVEKVRSVKEVEDRDEHLANNIREWEAGHRWVIGTVHGYYGEGEA